MIIGVPKEVKDHEARVALVPSGVTALREAGHLKVEGKDYVVADGDILNIRFNV